MPHKKPDRGERATKSKATTAKKTKAKVNPLKPKPKKVAGAGAFFGADSKSKGKKSTLLRKIGRRSMIDSLSLFLIVGVLIVGAVKRSEMALWLMLITMFGVLVSISNSVPDAAIVFFCGANLILMLVGFANWRKTRLNLPFFIAVLACFDVVAGFVHYMHLLNIGSASLVIGLVSGTIGYIQLMLVCFMEDKKGVMSELLNDSRDLFHSALHMGSDNNHGEHGK